MITIKDVTISIPIFSNQTNSNRVLKKSSLAGGILTNISRKKKFTEVKALSNITCQIKDGERVAIMGHNGSGKTTFLKLISGIYKPSSGFFSTDNDVYPIIHKGFLTSTHLSGYAASKAQYLMFNNHDEGLEEYIEKVIEFADIGDFFYLPIKIYSPGMQARLLFTLITSFYPKCIALDEGLGTADKDFKEKAQKKIDDMLSKSGTLVFASHSAELLKRYCNRAIIFEKGKIIFDGTLKEGISLIEN